MQPGHDGPDGRVHDLGDLLVGEALHVRQVDGQAPVLGELAQGVLDVGVRQGVQGEVLRAGQPHRVVGGGPVQLPVLDRLRVGLERLALLLAVGVDEGVGQDPVEPGLEVGAGPVLVEGAEGLGVGVLHEVLGIGPVTGHTQGGAVELVEVGQGLGLETGGPGGLVLIGRRPVQIARAIVRIDHLIQGDLISVVVDVRHQPRA